MKHRARALLVAAICVAVGACNGADGTTASDDRAVAVEPTATATVAPTAALASAPTATPTPEPTPTPTPEPTATPMLTTPATPESTSMPAVLGESRGNPYPFGGVMEAGDWRFEALEVIRGDEAWRRIQAANKFNEPPGAGSQYVLVLVRARYEGENDEDIDHRDFRITGLLGRADRATSVLGLGPWLNYTLHAGDDVEGWVAFEVSEDESRLMLVYDRRRVFDDVPVFMALEPDARLSVDRDALPVLNDDGQSRAAPAAVGSTVVTDTWAITVLEYVRGDTARRALSAAAGLPFIAAPGFEFINVLVRIQAVSSVDAISQIRGFDFQLTGNERVVYPVRSEPDLEPHLGFELFPGGVALGWLSSGAAQAETGLMLGYVPRDSSLEADVRFLALDDGAGVPIADVPLATATELGVDRESPVPLGELATTDQWEVRVLEVVRGEAALARVREADRFNDDPDQGMEYVQVRVRARSIGAGADAVQIDESWFSTIGGEDVRWDAPKLIEPRPWLEAQLYSGGAGEGWVTLQAAVDETDLLLVFEPLFDFSGEARRYLALS